MKSYLQVSLILVICLGCRQNAGAEVGNDNPTGVTGEYNGSITTGGSYDPYTGNAKRFVDDLSVTGSLGVYPLKWTRVLNTRNPGGWSHSYTRTGSDRSSILGEIPPPSNTTNGGK
jgi:hypothetical protein